MARIEQAKAAHRVGVVEVAARRRADARDVGALEALEDGVVEAGVAWHACPL